VGSMLNSLSSEAIWGVVDITSNVKSVSNWRILSNEPVRSFLSINDDSSMINQCKIETV